MAVKTEERAAIISDMTVRTIPGPLYIPPKPHEVTRAFTANEIDEKDVDMSLLADMVNLLDPGGSYTSADNDSAEAQVWAYKNKPKVDGCGRYYYLDINGNCMEARTQEDAIKGITATRYVYHNNIRTMLKKLDEQIGFSQLPGSSPLQKAITLVRMLAAGQKSGGSENNPNSGSFKPDKTVSKIKKAISEARNMSKDERELMSGKKKKGSKDGGGTGGCDDDTRELETVAIAEDMMTGKEKILKIARHLSSLSRMTIGRSHERVVDPEGRVLDPRNIEDFNGMAKLSQAEWAYPAFYRNYRIVSQQARMYERTKELAKKQCLYMIVDCSDSMHGEKTYIAGGCIMRGLKGVIAEDAEFYISFFDTSLHDEMEAKTPGQAKKVMQKVLTGNYSGGGTSIARCAKLAVTRIQDIVKKDNLTKPELIIVSDGEDNTSGLKEDDFAGIKLHVILIHNTNPEQRRLLTLAQSLGGIGIDIKPGMF